MKTSYQTVYQKGSVLIISLLLLIVTTLLGLSSMNNTIMEERMAGNLRQQNLSLQSAESALRDAEVWLASLDKNTLPKATDDGSTNIWLKDGPEGNGSGVPTNASGLWWTNRDVWDAWAVDYTTALSEITAGYIVEEYDKVSDTITVGQQQDTQSYQEYFQVTARGIGEDGMAYTYLRTTFARRF